MLRLFPRLMLVVGLGVTGAACQGDGSAPPPLGYYQSAPAANPYYNSGYYQPAPAANPYYNSGYYRPAPAANPYYNSGYYAPPARYGYTTVTVTNRGQNGNRDDVVQQQVQCGSQYYDGYRNRTARC